MPTKVACEPLQPLHALFIHAVVAASRWAGICVFNKKGMANHNTLTDEDGGDRLVCTDPPPCATLETMQIRSVFPMHVLQAGKRKR